VIKHLTRALAKIQGIFSNGRVEEELAKEIATHLQYLEDEFLRQVCRRLKPTGRLGSLAEAWSRSSRHIATNALFAGCLKVFRIFGTHAVRCFVRQASA